MLNIPESVKTLYKTDGTRKNLRIHFPNGEMTDITNENVVRESLRFTESVCSQDVFRFGCAERSVLEFETVGIGNMYGMKIDASIGIELAPLTEEQIDDIAAGTWDGELSTTELFDNSATSWRSGYSIDDNGNEIVNAVYRYTQHYFPINGGKRYYASCYKTRGITSSLSAVYYDANKQFISRVSLFRTDETGLHEGTFETPANAAYFRVLLSIYTTDEIVVHADPGDVFYMPLGTFLVESCPRNHGAMTHRQVTAYTLKLTDRFITSPYIKFLQNGAFAFQYIPNMQFNSVECLLDSNIYWNDLDGLARKYTKTEEITAKTAYNPSKTGSITSENGTLEYTIIWRSGWRKTALSLAAYWLVSCERNDYDNSAIPPWVESQLETLSASDMYELFLKEALKYTNPYFTHPYSANGEKNNFYFDYENIVIDNTVGGQLCCPTSVSVTLKYTPTGGTATTVTNTFTVSASGDGYRVFINRKNDISNQYRIAFAATSQNGSEYTFHDAFSVLEIYSAYAELKGKFAREDRYGHIIMQGISPSSPLAVVPGNYASAWWDEYDIAPIGTVLVSYSDDGAQESEAVSIGAGTSLYDMTENALIPHSPDIKSSTLPGILAGEFAEGAANAGFTPTEINMQGWPWMEAGDALEITADDGTVINTYALRVEMRGIQNLTATITSPSGEIVEEA